MSENALKHGQAWEEFAVQPRDLDYLINLMVETEQPFSLDKLAKALVEQRHQETADQMHQTLVQGRIYRPKESYQVGEKLILPQLENRFGDVIAVRLGHNPEYPSFQVLKIRLEDGSEHEYAAALQHPHPLNDAVYQPPKEETADSLYEQYGTFVREELHLKLESSSQFVSVGEQWFVRDLLMEVPAWQLNIAEALLDMAGGGPLPTIDFLTEMDLPKEIPQPLQIFCLEYALSQDHRFDEVGPTGQGVWYLRRMEPQGVRETPATLRYIPIPYNRGLLGENALALENRVDDEWAENTFPGKSEISLSVLLSYPHWRCGTLPLTARLKKFFPTARLTDRIRFSFVDGETREEFSGWVVRSGYYVYGLESWYQQIKIGVGAYIDLRQGESPDTIIIQARPLRSKRGEWLRTATVEGNKLAFDMTRVPVSCEFDEQAAIAVPDPAAVDALAEKLRRQSLDLLVEEIFRELAVLSLQRAVHAVTLYSAINLIRRVAPAPLLAALSTAPRYVSLGDNYWAYRGDEA